jgi:hypothetical protein
LELFPPVRYGVVEEASAGFINIAKYNGGWERLRWSDGHRSIRRYGKISLDPFWFPRTPLWIKPILILHEFIHHISYSLFNRHWPNRIDRWLDRITADFITPYTAKLFTNYCSVCREAYLSLINHQINKSG